MKTIKYASNGKRDIHGVEEEFDFVFDKIESEQWDFPSNQRIVIDYIKACKKGEAKSGGKNKRVGKSSLYRVLGIMRVLSESWLKKDFDQATQKDWDLFYDRMENDQIKNEYGSKFKPSSKAKNYKTIRKFLKWKYGNNKVYPEICDNWVTSEEKVEKDYLTRSEVEKMVNGSTTLKTKCLLMVLFDGGLRIEEAGNLRWMDLKKEEGRGYYKAEIRGETSKTKKKRVVSLWLATDMIDTYKNHLMSEKKYDLSAYIFDAHYHNLYMTIQRAGKSINKKISPHTLRHSSATYYASIIKTYQQFCARYGWSLRSSAPQGYFHSVDDDMVADQTKDHEIAKFKTEFERVKIENMQMQKKLQELEEKMANTHKTQLKQIAKELLAMQKAKK